MIPIGQEEFFKELVEETDNLVTQVDAEGKFTYVNPTALKVFGLPPRECVGLSAFEFIHPADRKRTLKWFANCVKNGVRKDTVENLQISRNGNIHKMIWTVHFSYDETGKPFYINAIAQDISLHKERERKRRINEERFFSLMEKTSEGCYLFEPPEPIAVDLPRHQQVARLYKTELVECNDALAKMYGYSQSEELLGKSLADLVGGVGNEINTNFLNAMVDNDYRLTHALSSEVDRNGNNIWFSNNIVGVVENGYLMRFWGTQVDVTDIKRSEEALLQKNYIIESASAAIAVYDIKGNLTYGNPAFLEMWGLDGNEDFVGRSFTDFWAVDDSRDDIAEAFKAGEKWVSEVKARRKNGTLFEVQVSAALIKNSNGDPVGAVWSSMDISGRKQEERLLAAKVRFSEMAAHHSINTLLQKVMDEAENLTGSTIGFFHFLEENQEIIKLRMWSANTIENMCRTNILEVIGKSYSIREAGVWAECIHKRGAVIHNDYASLPGKKGLPEGHAPLVRELVVPVIRGNKIRAILGLGNKAEPYNAGDEAVVVSLADHVWDIVERKRAEEALQELTMELENRVRERTLQLASVNKELEAFAYSVSHDLRAPLRAIGGFSEIIHRRYREMLPHEGRHYLENIIEACAQMGRLIEDLLTYSRLGRRAVNIAPLSLDLFFKSLEKKFTGMVKDVEGTITIPSVGCEVMGHITLLEQIFTNLVDNAVKYRKPGRRPEIKIDCQKAPNNMIAVRVIDNGVGIAAEKQDMVFNLFQRLHAEEVVSGTGIGLALVKKAVDLLNGRITLHSVPGQGTAFTVYLPKVVEGECSEKKEKASLSAL